MALLIVAFLWGALNVAYHAGARDFGWGFWLNLVVAVVACGWGLLDARREGK